MNTNLFFRRTSFFASCNRLCISLFLIFAIYGCGQKGPLYHPSSSIAVVKESDQASLVNVKQDARRVLDHNVQSEQ